MLNNVLKMSVHQSKWLMSLLLVVMVLVTFWPVLQYEFVNYDDRVYVSENPHLKDGLTWHAVQWAVSTGLTTNYHDEFWIPMTYLSHLATVELFGLDPAGHHGINVGLHVLNTVLLFLLLRRMTGNVWPSLFVAALFAVHPLHVESVAWVVERKDVLSTCFGFLTIGAYIYYAAHPGALRYLLVVVLFALSLMAKPMLVTLPMGLLLLDYWPLGRLHPGSEARQAVWPLMKEKLPLLLLSAASSVMTVLAQQRAGTIKTFEALSLWARFENALVVYVGYIGKMLWPHNLAVFYPHPDPFLPLWQVAGAALLIGSITVLVLLQIKRRPYLFVGWSWYLGTLVPVIGLIQIGSQAMADRYTYVPLIGLFIIIAWGGADLTAGWRHRRAIRVVAATILCVTLMGIARLQVHYWRNSLTLFEHALAVTSDNYVAHNNLGIVLVQQNRIEEAKYHYAEALRLAPGYFDAHYNLGLAFFREGNLDQAIYHYSQALSINSNDEWAHSNLGLALAQQGRLDEAILHYSQALSIDPDDATTHNNLGLVLVRKGELAAAIAQFSQALQINPDDEVAHHNLSVALSQQAH